MEEGFSGVVRISNISDFIAPAVNCIISTDDNVTKQAIVVNKPLKRMGTSDQTYPDDNKKKTIKISLNDCLACSGCVTSAETVLINDQSLVKLLDELKGRELSVVTVSPQSVCSIAAQRGITVSDAARLIASYFISKGITYVLDSSFGRQIALKLAIEEFFSSEKRPILSSACPGFVCYAEKTYGKMLLPFISRIRSPQAIHGALVKDYLAKQLNISPNNIFHATVMPCFDKKLEASRTDFLVPGTQCRETDCVISSAELESELYGTMSLCNTDFPMGWLGDFGRGNLIGTSGTSTSGGYADYIIDQFISTNNSPVNTLQMAKNLTVTEVGYPDKLQLRVARIYGFKNIQNFVRKMKSGKCIYDYVEIMACPSGCSNGGGQIRGTTADERESLLTKVEDHYHQINRDASQEMENIVLEWSRINPKWKNLVLTEYHEIETNSRPILQW